MCAEGGGAIVLEEAAAKALAAALGPHKATIHRNHGLFTVGHSVDEAAWWFITMERSCQAQLLAEAAGTPVLIDDEGARYTRDHSARARRRVVLVPAAMGRDLAQRARPLRLDPRGRGRPGGPPTAGPVRRKAAAGCRNGSEGPRIADCPQNRNVF